MMRWKGIIGFATISIILSILSFFFTDNLVKGVIESVGSRIVGAKVEVNQLELSFFNLSLKIEGLQVADPDDEWRNLFEAQAIKFQVGLRPLLEKKVSINEMVFAGIQMNTPRTTSGKLVKIKKKSKGAKADDGFWAQGQELITEQIASLPAFQMLKGKQEINVDELFKLEQLNAPNELNKIRQELDTKHQNWQTSLTNLNISPQLDEIKKQIDSVDLKTKKLKKIKKEIKKLKEIKKALKKVHKQVNSTQKQLQTDFDFMDNSIKRIDQLKEEDYQNIVKTLDIKDIDKEAIAQLVFGPVWLERAQTWLYWLDKARRLMPEKKATKELPERVKGMNVAFPREKGYPGFLLKRALLSTAGKSTETATYDFQGEVTGISSDPSLYGQPCLISAQGTQPEFELKGTLDHTGEISRDQMELKFKALALNDFSLGRSSLLPQKISQGKANVDVNLLAQGDEIELKISIFPKDLTFAPEDIPSGNLAHEIARILTTAQDLRIDGEVSGHKNKLRFKIKSNIDELLTRQIKNMVLAKIENTKQQIKARIDQQVDQKKTELLNDFQAKRAAVESRIQEKLQSVTQIDGLIDKRIDKIKKNLGKGLLDKFKK